MAESQVDSHSGVDQKPALRVKRAGPDDDVLLARLGEQTFHDSYAANNVQENIAAYVAANFSPEKQAAELADPNIYSLIAWMDDRAIGYAQLRKGPSPASVQGEGVIEIVRIYSKREWIGRGVGRALMEACLNEAARRKCDAIWLGVWTQNPRAIAFYRKWGFEEVGTQVFRMGNDEQTDLVMQRRIS